MRIFAVDIRDIAPVGDTRSIYGATMAVHSQLEASGETIVLHKRDVNAELRGGIMDPRYTEYVQQIQNIDLNRNEGQEYYESDENYNTIFKIAYGSSGKVLHIHFTDEEIAHQFIRSLRFIVEREQVRNSLDSTNVYVSYFY